MDLKIIVFKINLHFVRLSHHFAYLHRNFISKISKTRIFLIILGDERTPMCEYRSQLGFSIGCNSLQSYCEFCFLTDVPSIEVQSIFCKGSHYVL